MSMSTFLALRVRGKVEGSRNGHAPVCYLNFGVSIIVPLYATLIEMIKYFVYSFPTIWLYFLHCNFYF
jgi:hypothetical protein